MWINEFFFFLKIILFFLKSFYFRHAKCAPMIAYKKTDKLYIKWQRLTTNDNEWQRVVQRMAINDNNWQRVIERITTGDNEWHRVTTNGNEWHWVVQWVTTSNTTSDREWQQMAMSDSEWEQWYSKWKRHSTLHRIDDCHHFNDKKRYTTTSRDGWLQLECLNKLTFLKVL